MRAVRLVTPIMGVLLLTLAGAAPARATGDAIDGIRFLNEAPKVFAPARALGEELGLTVEWRGGSLFVNDEQVEQEDQRQLPDGTLAVQIRALPGATVTWRPELKIAEVGAGKRLARVAAGRVTVTDGISFADGGLFAPLREAEAALGLDVEWNAEERRAVLGGTPLPAPGVRTLLTGMALLGIEALEAAGSTTTPHPAGIKVEREGKVLWIRRAEQRVAVSIGAQRLRAWQGRRLVLDTNVSTGKRGHETPTGMYRAGPIKGPLLISRKYGNAKVPWAVQVHGDVLIHGFPSVPPRAASHGCIRMPLTRGNVARWFYEWVQLGSPIHIGEGWPTEWPVDQPGRSAGG